MCGICGIAFTDRARLPEPGLLQRMSSALVHRGPDGQGAHAAPGVGLGMRRLSIIDVAHGDQPIESEDGQVVVICNGEIYNHVELRADLEAAGHRFRSHADTEVIVHLYEDHGDAFVDRLRGMFAIALWDARRRRLLLVRDRLGIKPLHYVTTADGIAFASEQKALLAAGVVRPEPDLAALADTLSYGRVIGARTMLAGVRRLLPGHWLAFEGGRTTEHRYWDARFPPRDAYEQRPRAAWAGDLRDKLDESVRLHLRSDVPVGAWLSPGIDSSSVTALMARRTGPGRPTFTLRFEDPRFDELASAQALDEFAAFGLVGHRVACTRADIGRFPQAVLHAEDTLMPGIIAGQLILAEATAPHVKVVLTGEGSDEILGGYSWYPTLRVLQPLLALPAGVRRGIAALPMICRRWPGAASVLAGGRAMDFERYARSITHLRGQQWAATLLSTDARAAVEAAPGVPAPPPPADFATWHPFAQLQYFDIKHRLAEAVEQGLDRASMAHSVEARVPFLDHELVEFCARIPPAVKMRGLREKAVLREAMRDVLPDAIVGRRKSPMRVPTDDWMRGTLPGWAEELLAPAALRDTGYFDPDAVRRTRARHGAGAPLGQVVMTVLGMQIWDDVFRRGGRVTGVA